MSYLDKIERILRDYYKYLDSKGPRFVFPVAILCVFLVGVFDQYAPKEMTHSFMYLLPISFVSWFCNRIYGIALSVLCTAIWAMNNIHPEVIITVWNILSTFVFFSMLVFLLNKTRELFENEKALSRTDTLTGAINLRAFKEMVEHEMLRSEREGLTYTIAYIDLDDFKQINDTYGHSAGDQLLKSIVGTISQNLRKTDILGRLGGDEFAIFLPATDRSSVETVMQKIHIKLAELVDSLSYRTSISAGAIICEAGTHSFDQLISVADNLMYQVKSSGKNNTFYLHFPITQNNENVNQTG
ncbi:MAG: hypothetical protein C0623_04755 [Desulfuromonas sp.]|nr:MAG: hypothetical protein C0623_04755 [Desulfuromonas sp.]